MVDQTYLGNCIVLRKNSYDNGHTWKNHIPEIDFNQEDWVENFQKIIDNYKGYQSMSREYYEKYWNPKSIVGYFKDSIDNFLNDVQ